jgi:hypothetical protein
VPNRVAVGAIILTFAWLLAHGPTVPGGFINDDFAWVLRSQIDGWRSVVAAFTHADGFYRPIVQLSFGISDAIWGTDPLPYALTNLGLALAAAAAIYALSVALGLPSWAALVATAVWAFNFHGINMGVAWFSGRTSLFGTLFATLGALAFTRHRPLAAGLLCFAALLSKEEVIALPAILTLWAVIDRSALRSTRSALRSTLPMWAVLLVYLVLRGYSGAFGISDAPPFYQFSTDPSVIGNNLLEYADRAMTFGVLTMALALVMLGCLPARTDHDTRLILKGSTWLVCGFALTLWLPVRSSLYVVFPSVGFAIVTAVVVSAAAAQATTARARAIRTATVGLVLPFLLLPVYWSRNVGWTELRALSTETFHAIEAEPLTSHTLVVLEDDLSTRANFRNTFGTLFPAAAALYFGAQVDLWIDPPSPEITSAAMQRPDAQRVATFRLVGGRVERASPQVSFARGACHASYRARQTDSMPPLIQ